MNPAMLRLPFIQKRLQEGYKMIRTREKCRARVGTENQRLGGRASSRSLAGRHGLIYGMEAGRFIEYWAGGVVASGFDTGSGMHPSTKGNAEVDSKPSRDRTSYSGSRVGNTAQPKTFTRPLVVRLGSMAVFFIGGE